MSALVTEVSRSYFRRKLSPLLEESGPKDPVCSSLAHLGAQRNRRKKISTMIDGNRFTVLTYGINAGIMIIVKAERKITVMLPKDLLARALEASGEGITPTLRKGLELVAAKAAYRSLLKLKGRFDLKMDLDELRRDRPL